MITTPIITTTVMVLLMQARQKWRTAILELVLSR